MYTSAVTQLDDLQTKINVLKQQQLGGYNFQPNNLNPLSNNITPEQIQFMVQQEIAKYIPQAKLPEPEVPLTEHQKMIKEINDLAASVLSAEDLSWLSDSTVLKGVPLFLKSVRGKEAFSLLLSEYRSYVEGK